MSNSSATLANITSGVNINDLSTTSSIYDPKYSAIGIGTSPYYVGDGTYTTGDPLWTKDNYKVGEWTYTDNTDWYVNTKPVDEEMLETLKKWYAQQQYQKVAKPAPVDKNSKVRRKMEESNDVGRGLAEMINEL